MGLVAPSVTNEGDLFFDDIVEHVHERLFPPFIAGNPVVFNHSLKERHHFVGFRIYPPDLFRILVVEGVVDDAVPFGPSLFFDDVFCKFQITGITRQFVQPHNGLQNGTRFNVVGTPPLVHDGHLRMRTGLGQDTVGMVNHGLQDFWILFHLHVIFIESQQYIFPFPQIAPGAVGLTGNLRATETPVFTLGSQHIGHSSFHDLFHFGIGRVPVEHAA